MAKEYFKANGLSYSEYNVADDDARRDEMVEKSGQLGVPVIDINGQIFVGFNKPEIEAALR
jgi:glutaredoxin 3